MCLARRLNWLAFLAVLAVAALLNAAVWAPLQAANCSQLYAAPMYCQAPLATCDSCGALVACDNCDGDAAQVGNFGCAGPGNNTYCVQSTDTWAVCTIKYFCTTDPSNPRKCIPSNRVHQNTVQLVYITQDC